MVNYNPPGDSQTAGVALTLMQANGCSSVDTPVMPIIQLWYNPPLYVNGNEQFSAAATTSVQKYYNIIHCRPKKLEHI